LGTENLSPSPWANLVSWCLLLLLQMVFVLNGSNWLSLPVRSGLHLASANHQAELWWHLRASAGSGLPASVFPASQSAFFEPEPWPSSPPRTERTCFPSYPASLHFTSLARKPSFIPDNLDRVLGGLFGQPQTRAQSESLPSSRTFSLQCW
jgi:hypothetical protein